MNSIDALKELLYKMADDQLIAGHRYSEWTGLGPLLEEDIAFSSMAQDKIGQSEHLYNLLHQLGEADADTVAFTRNAPQFHNAILLELPMGEYDFAMLRHLMFDYAELLRFNSLQNSSYVPLAQMAKKFYGEVKYHSMHASTWVRQLGTGNSESNARMQKALNEAWNYGLGLFEEGPAEDILIKDGIFEGEAALREKWLKGIKVIFDEATLTLPDESLWAPKIGGRKGEHSIHLQPLLDEMTEVYSIDPTADW